MTMKARPGAGLAMEQEHRNTGITLIRADKLMRTTNKRKLLLPHVMHLDHPPGELDECGWSEASGMIWDIW
jgi:hypothetical protein